MTPTEKPEKRQQAKSNATGWPELADRAWRAQAELAPEEADADGPPRRQRPVEPWVGR